MRRLAGVAAVAVAAGVGAGAAQAANAMQAATWCGTTTTQDRPPALTGRSIRVIYAYPSDGGDRSAELASQFSADVDAIDAWWLAQDPAREPRFDRVAFSCGLQADILSLRLSDTAATLQSSAVRGDRIEAQASAATGRSPYEKLLVYYDGPVDDADLCGEGAGTPGGDGIAMVYLGACTDIPSANIAAHELLHSFGALPDGAPHACPDTRGHPCDSETDVLYPFAMPGTTLASLVLDVGRDDYYGHAGGWPDLQDSPWLRLVSRADPADAGDRGTRLGGERRARRRLHGLVRDGLGRGQRGRARAARGRRPALRALVGRVHGIRSLRGEARRGALGCGPLRARSVRARRRGRRQGEGDGSRSALRRVPVRADGPVVHASPSARHAGEGMASCRMERWLHRPDGDVHGAHDEGGRRPRALRQALSQASSVVCSEDGAVPPSSARISPTVPQRSATTSWSWIVSRFR